MSTEFFRKYIEIIKEAEESTNQQIAKIFARYANNLSKLAGQDGYSEDDIIDIQKTAKAFYQSMELGLKEWRLLHNLIQNPPTTEVMDDLGIDLRQEYNKLAGQVNESFLPSSGATWDDVLNRVNVFQDIFGDQDDVISSTEWAQNSNWPKLRNSIFQIKGAQDLYNKVRSLAKADVELTDEEYRVIEDMLLATDGGYWGGTPGEPWSDDRARDDYPKLKDWYLDQLRTILKFVKQK